MRMKSTLLVGFSTIIVGCGGGDGGAVDSTSSQIDASSCFGIQLFEPGTRITMTTRKNNIDSVQNALVKNAQFQGQDVIEQYNEDTGDSLYLTVDAANKSYFIVGGTDANQEWYYSPPSKVAFDLKLGETDSGTHTMISGTDQFVYDESNKFVGMEVITIAAGTFDTCKFEHNSSVTLPSGEKKSISSERWVLSGYSIAIKIVAGGNTTELVSGSINGDPISN
ncbi:hypothetical protein ACQEXU_04100 [Vibrio sp. TRT 21S02]|uniref:hypothetical protein n=1 Tax=Vibrio sp. TRT 21S02 TaxID=3418507 RepID=UPI003CF99BD2